MQNSAHSEQGTDVAATDPLDDTATLACVAAPDAQSEAATLPVIYEITLGVRSDVGVVREDNEDAFVFVMPEQPDVVAARGVLLAVADGMGGHAAGARAATCAVNTLRRSYYGDLTGGVGAALERAYTEANARVLELASRTPQDLGMGSTLVSAVVCQDELTVANLGDSRAYLFRDGVLEQLTEDHNVAGDLLRANLLTEEEARLGPHRSQLTRCIGFDESLGVDLFTRRPRLQDVILLCSDGLPQHLSDEQIAEVLMRAQSPSIAAHELVDEAIAAGGTDNVTVIAARIDRIRRPNVFRRMLRRR